MAQFIWLHQHPISVCKLVSANYCFQVKSSFEDHASPVDVGWGRMGVDEHIGSFQYAIEMYKPMFELPNSVRFTEYLRTIFKWWPPNICISTSVSTFDDT